MFARPLSLPSSCGVLLLMAAACSTTEEAPERPAPAAATEASAATKAAPPTSAAAPTPSACRACREKYCANYQGIVNLVETCLDNKDKAFASDCQGAVACAQKHDCAWAPLGSTLCVCGSEDVATCLIPGGAKGPCQAEFLRAGRAKTIEELSPRFSELSSPAGAAHYLLQCDYSFCPACRGG